METPGIQLIWEGKTASSESRYDCCHLRTFSKELKGRWVFILFLDLTALYYLQFILLILDNGLNFKSSDEK